MSHVVVIFGGRSEIGLAVATRLAPGATVVLAARPGSLSQAVADCRAAGAGRVEVIDFDADDIGAQPGVVDAIEARHMATAAHTIIFDICLFIRCSVWAVAITTAAARVYCRET